MLMPILSIIAKNARFFLAEYPAYYLHRKETRVCDWRQVAYAQGLFAVSIAKIHQCLLLKSEH
jgi:hypothetical protein